MSKNFTIILLFTITFNIYSQIPYSNYLSKVQFNTNRGIITIGLYEETYQHGENFIKLVKEGYYDGLLFHRVIKDFMIQTGDPKSKNAKPGIMLGSGGPKYTIPAEIFPQYFHKYGALAGARQPDNINPKKASSGSQFYIVVGKIWTNEELDAFEIRNLHPKFSKTQRELYTSIGGTPHLDYNYTVFGEVINGMEIIKSMSTVNTDKNDRPLEDLIIITAKIIK